MKSKILVILSIIIFLISILTINSLAVITSATASLTASKSSYNLDDENEIVTVTLRLDNLQSNNGVIAYSAILEYDKDKLTYLDCSAVGDWSKPSYSEENGQLVADRADNNFSANGEDLCTIRFKLKAAGDNIVIKLSNIELSSGELGGRGLKKIDDVQTLINITKTTEQQPPVSEGDSGNQGQTPTPNPTPTPNLGEDNSNQGGNNDNTQIDTPNANIPQLGDNNYIFILIGFAVIIAIVLFIRMKLLNIKIKKNYYEDK